MSIIKVVCCQYEYNIAEKLLTMQSTTITHSELNIQINASV